MTHPDPLRVIVFGAGVMGAHHVRVLRRDPDVELVAVVDPDGDRAARVRDRARVVAPAQLAVARARAVSRTCSARAVISGLALA